MPNHRINSSPRLRRSLRAKGKPEDNSTNLSPLLTTIITVLLTFFLTTVGGSAISFWMKINEADTQAAYEEMERALVAYEYYLSEIDPEIEKAQTIGTDLISELVTTQSLDKNSLVTARMSDYPDLGDHVGNGSIALYLGKEADIGINALNGQLLAMKVMIERNTRAGEPIPVERHEAMKYLTNLRVGYSYYLLEIVKCKQAVAKSFMLSGKMHAMEECEAPDERVMEDFSLTFWGPGIFEK